MPRHAVKPAVATAFAALALASYASAPLAAKAPPQNSELAHRFEASIEPEELQGWLKAMSAEPNHVGSPHDKANAEFMLARFKEWGWDARIETFQVLYPTLKSHALELVAPTRYVAKLAETPIDGDESSKQRDQALPPFHAYGGDGDVTGKLVYVNYGMPDDYKTLARLGVDVKGKIAIARYGAGWRGLKPKLAYQHGAIGCIVYSDPKDDGYVVGETYPKGAYRPPQGVQRGSVADMPVYPGDPLTPGVGATEGAKRLPLAEAKTVLKIPVLPISYSDAQPLLEALGGEVAPAEWRGGLPITYHVGPGPAEVHLAVANNWDQKPVYDVIATLRGSAYPDEWVLRGNHHDGWTFGASDPLSGNVALMAEIKAFGMLAKQGWRPKRTLVYASWDGEEPGLLGSTEWAEAHADELRQKAVLYINTDGNARGFLYAAGSHTFQHVVNQVAGEVADPQTGVPVARRARARLQVEGYAPTANEEAKKLARIASSEADLPIDALGSGSDFTPFLQHVGVASLNLEFGGEGDSGGVYHSLYDDYEHNSRFVDPGAKYGVALARVAGRIAMEVADAEIVPVRFGDFAATVSQYLDEVRTLSNDARTRSDTLGRLIDAGAFRLAADPQRTWSAPPREDAVPFLDLSPLENAVARLKRSAEAYDDAFSKSDHEKLPAERRVALNRILIGMEQKLLSPDGLPGRDWYKHLIYAPGLYTGYGVKTLPGVREAIEERQWDLANRYAALTAKALENYCDELDRAASLLRSS